MSELQEIFVQLLPDGTVKVDIQGVHGERCLEITERMESLLGGEVLDRSLTDEYRLQERSQDDRLREEL